MRYIFLLTVFFCVSCGKKIAANQTSDNGCKQNSKGSHAICITPQSGGKSADESAFSYTIVDKMGKVLFKGSVDTGTVEWMNDDAVAITRIPGNVSSELSDDDYVKVYVISKGEVMTKKDYMNKE